MFGSFESRRSVVASGIFENKIPAPIFNREAGDTLSENSKNPHDTFVSPKGHTAAGAAFPALDKDFRLTESLSQHNI